MRRALRLIRMLRPYWGWLALGVLAGIARLLGNIGLMAASGWFVAAMGVAGAVGGTLDYFTPAALIRAFAILRTGGRYAERVLTHDATLRVISGLRVWLFARLERLPLATLGGLHSADVANRLKTDVDRLDGFYLRILAPLAVALVGAIGLVAWLASHSGRLAAVETLLLVLAGVAVPLILLPRMTALGRARVRDSALLTEMAVDFLQGMPELAAFNALPVRLDALAAKSRGVVEAQRRLGRAGAITQAALVLGSNLALWLAVAIAVPLVRSGAMNGPDLVMLALAAMAGFEAVAPAPIALFELGAAAEAISRVFALADAAPTASPLPTRQPMPTRCDIVLSGVGLGYADTSATAGPTLDLRIPRGRRVAIRGMIGAGKSILILRLTGLLPVTTGRIEIDGQPVETYDPEALRACFSVAPQTPGLLGGSIRETLSLGAPDASEAAMWQALALAQLKDVVAALPFGLDTWVGQAGITLSGGQARRLSIARAVLRQAPVLILDEPGEGLDEATYAQLLSAVLTAMAGRTIILVTHSEIGLDLMDDIVTLDRPPSLCIDALPG